MNFFKANIISFLLTMLYGAKDVHIETIVNDDFSVYMVADFFLDVTLKKIIACYISSHEKGLLQVYENLLTGTEADGCIVFTDDSVNIFSREKALLEYKKENIHDGILTFSDESSRKFLTKIEYEELGES